VLASAQSVRTTCVRPVFVNGDHVVINWIFEFTYKDGRTTRLDELAHQRWQGDRIAEERFYYNPAQLKG
jgi:ketosteroid isomerase-like protein